MQWPEIVSAEPAGDLVHICVRKGVDVEHDLIPTLPSEIEQFQSISPSLEDVFIAMVSEAAIAREATSG